MSKKERYKNENLQFLKEISLLEDTVKLPSGVLYRVITKGEGTVSPALDSIVSVHYTGTLINGREFDNSRNKEIPEALRLSHTIDGWQLALQRMHVGDRWTIYIPYTLGYGKYKSDAIPGFSTLVFDVELFAIA